MAADPKTRSRRENEQELQRLHDLYNRLPPDKKEAQRVHIQKRIDALMAAIQNPGRSGGGGMSGLQLALLVILACVVAVGLGFFGVTYLARG